MAIKVLEPVKIETITVTTDISGNAAQQSTNIINGEIDRIAYDLGTMTSAPITLTNYTALTGTVRETIDAFTMTASVIRYPKAAVTGSSAGDNKWCKFVVNDYLLVTVASGDASQSFTVYVYYR